MFLSAELSLQPQRIFFLVWNPVLTTEEETNPAVSSCVVCTNMFLSVYIPSVLRIWEHQADCFCVNLEAGLFTTDWIFTDLI